ncbi:MAG: MgtC/SapB family protein [Burkholderiales bacterium]|nr:MgtC/SapB family protein [Burkholderiales bacterium]
MLIGFCVALGIGLLVGAERERRKEGNDGGKAEGIRTFSIAALLGAVSIVVGGNLLLAVTMLFVGSGALIAYMRTRNDKPGLTTEFALVLTCLLGGLATVDPELSAGVGATLTLLLAARHRLHYFVRKVLTEQEMQDIILFMAIALIVLPVAPNRYLGPFDAINLYSVAKLIVTMMAISSAGYLAMRWLGANDGLPLAGFASGFISSTATVYSMGKRATSNNELIHAAVCGATFSSLASIIQMGIVILLVQPALLKTMAIPLGLGCLAIFLYGLLMLAIGRRQEKHDLNIEIGRAVDLKASVLFALLLSSVLVISAGLNTVWGNSGIYLVAFVTGFADAHSTTASAASLVAAGKIGATQAIVPILLGLSTNTFTKICIAFYSGCKTYAWQVIPGLLAMIAAAWFGAWIVL